MLRCARSASRAYRHHARALSRLEGPSSLNGRWRGRTLAATVEMQGKNGKKEVSAGERGASTIKVGSSFVLESRRRCEKKGLPEQFLINTSTNNCIIGCRCCKRLKRDNVSQLQCRELQVDTCKDHIKCELWKTVDLHRTCR